MIFDMFPYTNFHELNLDWILHEVKKMSNKLDEYVVNNQIEFADPINWLITTQYPAHIIVKDADTDTWYISRKPVPAGISITNMEYWEELGAFTPAVHGLICNVQDFGVLGVDGADYTAQLQEALNDTAYIAYYFPAGTYSFGTVTISRPVLMFGDGEDTVWKPLHRISTSNQYKTMLQAASDLVLKDIKFVGDNSVVTQTGNQFYQDAIVQCTGDHFRMTGCTIDQIFDTYHLSQGNLEFYDRNGLLLYVYETKTAEIDHCTFKQYGGEELVWISRSLAHFGDEASILVHDNSFIDKLMLDNGGQIDGGSAINVLGGDVKFYNNICNNYYERGSFVNLLGNHVEVYNNSSFNSDMSSWIDTCEGYYIKSQDVYFHDNYQEDTNGVTQYSVKAQSKKVRIINNHLEGSCPIKTYGLADPATYADTTYIKNISDWPVYELADIQNNTLILTKNPSNYANSGISLNQSNQAIGSRSTLDKCYVIGNKLINKGVTNFFNTLYTAARIPYFLIKDNVFPFAGASAPSSSYLSVICLNEYAAAGDLVLIEGNHFDSSNVSTIVRVFQQQAQTITNTVGMCGHNTINSAASTKAFATTTATGFTGDYNLGFTSII